MLYLLQELFDRIVVPQAVYDELVTTAQNRPGAAEIRQAHWIGVRKVSERTSIDYLRADLDPGEAEALVLAMEIGTDRLLVDETKARLAAELLGIPYIGTIGILLLAKRLNKIEAIGPVLSRLRAEQFYISEKVYVTALQQAGEPA